MMLYDNYWCSCSVLARVLLIELKISDLHNRYNILIMSKSMSPPLRWPSDIVLASSAGGPGFNPQSTTASYQRRYKNGTSSALV